MGRKIYDDDYLLMLVHENNDDATETIYGQYDKVIKYKAFKYKYYASKLGLEFDDLVQEGYIGLSQAISDYSMHKEVKFSTFASLCIEREIQSAIMKASRKKHSLLNDSMSMDKELSDGVELSDFIASTSPSTEQLVIGEMIEQEDLKKLFGMLTDFERDVFDLKYSGFEYKEIAELLGKSDKSVDNAIQRVKRKIRNLFD